MSHRHYSIQDSPIPQIDIRLLSISLCIDDKDWSSVFHTHHFTELFYVLEGAGKFLLRNETLKIKAGDLLVIPPYLEHTERSSPNTPLKYYALGLDGIAFQSMDDSNSVQAFSNFDCQPSVGNLIGQIYREVKTESYGSDMVCQNLLEILVVMLIRSQQLIPIPISSARMSKECAVIKEYLDANYAEHITLDTLTRLTHMNKYYMAHSFAKFTGLSPIQYLNQRRMETACQLLKDTDFSISDIASSTGFSSQSYFSQTFRKYYGITPIKYRQSHAED